MKAAREKLQERIAVQQRSFGVMASVLGRSLRPLCHDVEHPSALKLRLSATH
jgi:hypothetical protein